MGPTDFVPIFAARACEVRRMGVGRGVRLQSGVRTDRAREPPRDATSGVTARIVMCARVTKKNFEKFFRNVFWF